MSHTKEPWMLWDTVDKNGVDWLSVSTNGECRVVRELIANVTDKKSMNQTDIDNGKRIVACVNACRDIPQAILEQPDYSIKAELDSLDEQIKSLKYRIAMLSAVLSSVVNRGNPPQWVGIGLTDREEIINTARKTLASNKGM